MMGQQQLLLIVLGVIIIGIAILMGITLFRAHAIETKKDSLLHDCASIGNLAQKYYWTPREMGGGGRSFDGFVISADFLPTANGTYEITTRDAEHLLITATANDVVVDNDPVSVQMRILPKTFAVN